MDLRQLLDDVTADGLTTPDRLLRVTVLKRGVEAYELELLASLTDAELTSQGARGVNDWLTKRADANPTDAARFARVAEALPSMPGVAAAIEAGVLSIAEADLLANISGYDAYAENEADLIDKLAGLPWRRAREAVRRFVVEHSEPSVDEEAPSIATLNQQRNGRWQLWADLSEADGLRLQLELTRILGNIEDKQGTDWAELVAMALVIAMHRSCSLGDKPAGARPEVIVVLNADDATATVDGNPVRPDTVSLFLCDANVRRAILDADRECVDLGRTVRFHSPAQRRRREAMHGGCTMPGCDAPPSWCRMHHPQPWGKHGHTDEDGVPRCPRCHTVDHKRGYTEYVRQGVLVHHHEDGRIEEVRPVAA